MTGHPGMATQLGPAGKVARTVGWRPGEALAQPNPTPALRERELGPKFDRINTYCCSDQGVVCACHEETQAVTIASGMY